MDVAAIQYLNQINRRFYETVAAEFDASRQRAWAGWEQLLPLVGAGLRPAPTVLNILDVGCGNGRFGVFLMERFGKDALGRDALHYHGIDSSAALLDKARAAVAGIEAHLEQYDIVEQPLDTALGQFDLVVLFGVLHHIPGADRRLDLLRALGEHVAPGGLLVFTEWLFYDDPHLRERIVDWEVGVQVEPGDYLLDWKRGVKSETSPVLRYCHAVDAAEHQRLVAATGLQPLTEYRADAGYRAGGNRAGNLYTIFINEKKVNTP